MPNANVHPLTGAVNPATVDEVMNWIEQKAEKGEIAPVSGRLRNTAIRQLMTVLGDDEPRTNAEWVLANLHDIAQRWGRLHPESKGDTVSTYEARARGGFEMYFTWLKDPAAFKAQASAPRRESQERKRERPEPKTEAPMATTVPVVAVAQPARPHSEARNFPLGKDREPFVFALPPDGITFADVRKIAVHLFTLSRDFDIADEGQAKVFQMVVRGDG